MTSPERRLDFFLTPTARIKTMLVIVTGRTAVDVIQRIRAKG
jgi:hypothetical protein